MYYNHDVMALFSDLHLPKAELNTRNSTKQRRMVEFLVRCMVEFLVSNSIYLKKWPI